MFFSFRVDAWRLCYIASLAVHRASGQLGAHSGGRRTEPLKQSLNREWTRVNDRRSWLGDFFKAPRTLVLSASSRAKQLYVISQPHISMLFKVP